MADGDEDTRAGDGPSRQGDAGLVALGAGDRRADHHGAGLVEGHVGEAARARGATQEIAEEPPSAGGAVSGETGAEGDRPAAGGVVKAVAGVGGAAPACVGAVLA